jgi:hypothetical protein
VAWRGREPKLVAEAVQLAGKWREIPQSVRGEVLRIAVDANSELFKLPSRRSALRGTDPRCPVRTVIMLHDFHGISCH